MPRSIAPPPEKVAMSDVVHIIFSILMIPLGLIIVYHTVVKIQNVMGYLVGISFVAFGAYRLYMAYTRYHLLRQHQSKTTK
jgi:predicted membrane channel-forming protein YqfA (hemolysin III family)